MTRPVAYVFLMNIVRMRLCLVAVMFDQQFAVNFKIYTMFTRGRPLRLHLGVAEPISRANFNV